MAWPLASLSPFSIAHRTPVSLQGKGLFSRLPIVLGKCQPCLSSWNAFSSPESPSHFCSQIIVANALCASELIGRRFHLLECLVGPFGLERDQRVVHRWWEKRPGEHLAARSQPPHVVERPPPCPEVFPPGLSQGLLSTKHNTNVLLDLSSSAPIYFSKNTRIPAASCLSALVRRFSLPSPPVLVHPLKSYASESDSAHAFWFVKAAVKGTGQPWGHWCKYVRPSLSLPHCSWTVCSIFPVSFAILTSIIWEKLFRFYFCMCGNKTLTKRLSGSFSQHPPRPSPPSYLLTLTN